MSFGLVRMDCHLSFLWWFLYAEMISQPRRAMIPTIETVIPNIEAASIELAERIELP